MEASGKHIVNVHEAKSHLSKLLARVEQGEEIIIARSGEPIARLSRVRKPRLRDFAGCMKGEIWLADDWDDPDPEIERLFGMRE